MKIPFNRDSKQFRLYSYKNKLWKLVLKTPNPLVNNTCFILLTSTFSAKSSGIGFPSFIHFLENASNIVDRSYQYNNVLYYYLSIFLIMFIIAILLHKNNICSYDTERNITLYFLKILWFRLVFSDIKLFTTVCSGFSMYFYH